MCLTIIFINFIFYYMHFLDSIMALIIYSSDNLWASFEQKSILRVLLAPGMPAAAMVIIP